MDDHSNPVSNEAIAREVNDLLDRLSAARDFSADHYFLPLGELVEQTLPNASAEKMLLLAERPEMRRRVVSPCFSDASAPVALREDIAAFARSQVLDSYFGARFGQREKRIAIADLAQSIDDSDLKAAVVARIQQQQKAGAAPTYLLVEPVDRIESLARDMLTVLASQRSLGGSDYPVSLRQLADLTRPGCTDKQVLDAAARKGIFSDQALLAVKKDINSPAVLLQDAVLLGESEQLLRFLLRTSRTRRNHLFSVPELAKRVTTTRRRAVATAFRTSTVRRIEEDQLPADIGCLWVNGAIRLFFLADVFPTSAGLRLHAVTGEEDYEEMILSRSEDEVRQLQGEFEQAFNNAFEVIDRRTGGHNFVSLVDLRAMLDAFSRTRFDSELRRLRSEQKYTLSSTQSRHGIRGAEREAAIQEEGLMLLHVTRRES